MTVAVLIILGTLVLYFAWDADRKQRRIEELEQLVEGFLDTAELYVSVTGGLLTSTSGRQDGR